jgi:hypothetical protein
MKDLEIAISSSHCFGVALLEGKNNIAGWKAEAPAYLGT